MTQFRNFPLHRKMKKNSKKKLVKSSRCVHPMMMMMPELLPYAQNDKVMDGKHEMLI
jgi:hypothetical protein